MTDPFRELVDQERWVAWRNETRNGKLTKVPYSPHTGHEAKADDPRTWNTRSAAEARARDIVNAAGGGIGIELGDLGDGTSLGGVDLDTCLSEGNFEPWAIDVIKRFDSYAEVSSSETGAKIFFRYNTADSPRLRVEMSGAKHGKMFKRANGADRPPAIELYLSNRYFTTTERRLNWVPDQIVTVPTNTLLWLLKEAGPAFAKAGGNDKKAGGSDNSRSGKAYGKGLALRRAGKTYEEMVAALLADPETAEWARTKGQANGQRELKRIWEKAEQTDCGSAVTLDDLYAYMPSHNYIYAPTHAMWPAASVNARIPPIPIFNPDGSQKVDDKGKAIFISPAAWLDRNRPVEQMTWAPGEEMVITDRLPMLEGGWVKRRGATTFNLYNGPIVEPGAPLAAQPWIDHVRLVYPSDAAHILDWFAHRVQRPGEKINHALVLGGGPGIGKDSLIAPVRYAIGAWNFQEVSPSQIMGRFNGYVRAVILRINEARDLGDTDRFKFYEHLKTLEAAPPEFLRVDEKNLREYPVLNCCGVVTTTNYKVDGIYLPADDRRHYVAWSDLIKEDDRFRDDYWDKLWAYYEREGNRAVAAYLRERDISKFDPKAPPPKTPAFWAIADANRAPEEPLLADILEGLLASPEAVTLSRIKTTAAANGMEIAYWLNEPRNQRTIPHRLEKCGYVPVRNPSDSGGYWKFEKKRHAVYAQSKLSEAQRLAAAAALFR